MRTLYLVRHAVTDWNAEARYQGQTDVPLNDLGRAQAQSLRERLSRRAVLYDAEVCAVVSSDLQRARESAEIAFAVPGRTLHLDPELRELRYGVFEGLSRDEIRERHGEAFARFTRDLAFATEGGESRADGRRRALRAIETWLERLPQPHLVIMTHGGILRQLLLHTFDDGELPTQLNFSNLCVHSVHVDATGWTYAGAI